MKGILTKVVSNDSHVFFFNQKQGFFTLLTVLLLVTSFSDQQPSSSKSYFKGNIFYSFLAFGEGNSLCRIRPKHILNAALSRIN